MASYTPSKSSPLSCVSVTRASSQCDVVGAEFCAITVGEPFVYVIPGFSVLSVELRQMRVKWTLSEEAAEGTYDVFVRNDPSLCRGYPAWMSIKNAACVQVEAFNRCVSTTGMILPPQGILILWEWEWMVEDDQHSTDSSDVGFDIEQQINKYLQSDSDPEPESDIHPPLGTHTVTFKCIGAVRDAQSQVVLRRVCDILEEGGSVPVRIEHEYDNPYDSKAIAFKCQLESKWQRIGYVVRECLDHVHEAIASNKIVSVTFSWVKYLVCWSRCGPGYYAGINITVQGEWPSEVVRCASTH